LGRALAAVGYGTQISAAEFDEGERIADTPIAPDAAETPVSPNKTEQQPTELTAIKAALKGLVQTHQEWADWKCKVIDEDVSDGQLKPHHLAKMREAVEALKHRGRLNMLYARAKAVVPACESVTDFKVYLGHLLKLTRVDVATLRETDLNSIEADIVKREAAKPVVAA